MWNRLDRAVPPDARRVFERLWVAGTMGALFTATFRSVADHWSEAAFRNWPSIRWQYTAILVDRYVYLLWFIGYFFVSHVKKEGRIPSSKNLVFDMVQSVAGLFAVIALGLVAKDLGFDAANYRQASAVANGAVAVICWCSLALFYSDSDAYRNDYVNKLRLGGAVAGTAVALLLSFQPNVVGGPATIIVGGQIVLLVLLWKFWKASLGDPRSL